MRNLSFSAARVDSAITELKRQKIMSDDVLAERFKIVNGNNLLPILDVTLDGKSISIADLVNVANQLASALNDRGCHFDVMKNESE